MRPLGSLRLGAAVALAIATAPAGAQERDTVKLVVKFVKRADRPTPAARFLPASCAACAIDETPLFAADNARETVVALTVPRARSLELAFDTAGNNVRRVIVEGGDLPFRVEAGRILVDVPPLADDAVTAAEFATHVVEPGMVLRFEHADPARRAGAYATGPLPDVQRAAANVLEFAQREVVRQLGLGRHVERNRLGRIQIMGFDTNAPHGHVDSPPHMHMHLRWPQNTGTQIGHFYIGPDGLLTHVTTGVKGIERPSRHYARGQAFTTVGPDGRGVYTHMITQEGWLSLGRTGDAPCLLRPDGPRGFADGATVACPGSSPRHITVRDDLATGRLTVTTDRITETFRYDKDTGRLTSPAEVVAPGASVFVPPET